MKRTYLSICSVLFCSDLFWFLSLQVMYTYIHTYIHTHIHSYIHTYSDTDSSEELCYVLVLIIFLVVCGDDRSIERRVFRRRYFTVQVL